MNVVIILGSARTNGETGAVVRQIQEISGWDVIDLNSFHISNYDYLHRNRDDDYLPLIRRIIHNYDVFVFATPVYWYAMSAVMKTFFDRLTDLLDHEKELGRQLRTKSVAALSSSKGSHLGDHFWLPFSESAGYLGMKFFGGTHFIVDRDENENIRNFVQRINHNTATYYPTNRSRV